jgi:hypothetical protein
MIFAALFSLSAIDISALERAISALESEINTLDSRSVPLECLLPVFAAMVFIGVAVEWWVIQHDWNEEMETWALWDFVGLVRSPTKPSSKKRFMERLSVFLVAAGIMGELILGLKISAINGELRSKNAALRRDSDQLLALVTDQAGDAVLEAYKSVSFLSDRKLNNPQKFVEALKGKPKARVELWYNPNDSEAWTFAREIYWWLGEGPSKGEGAGWRVSAPIPIPPNKGILSMGAYPTAPIGMRFDGSGTSSGLTFIAKNLIRDTTNRQTALGVLTDVLGQSIYPLRTRSTSFSGAENPSLPDDLVIVVVGPKPSWYFGLDEQEKASVPSSNKPKNN